MWRDYRLKVDCRPGCEYCRRVKTTILNVYWRVKWVTQAAEIGFINTDEPQNQSLLKLFSVTSVPTIVRINRRH